jgi:glycosyltransferase involved in cell wall biosynthesis
MILSICCITYNHEKFIEQTIEGFLMQQTDFPFEIVIHDDASSDDTATIVKRFADENPNKIRATIWSTNKGMMLNFSGCMQDCCGKYIALCEGDDYWIDPYKLQKQVDFLEANEDYAICFHRANVFQHGELKLHPIPEVKNEYYTYADLLATYNFIMTASVVFRNIKLFPAIISSLPYGDMGLYFALTRNLSKIGCLPHVMSVYRIHENGVWSNIQADQRLKIHYKFYKQLFPYLNREEKKIARKKIVEFSNKISLLEYPCAALWRNLYRNYLKL